MGLPRARSSEAAVPMSSRRDARYRAAMLFGAHESVSGGVSTAFGRAKIDECRAIQIFTKNSNQWKEPVLAPEALAAFRDARAAYGAAPVMAHASYLINLGTDDATVLGRSI